MGNNPGELRAHGHEEGFFTFVELAAFFLLDDQHADNAAVVNDRCAEERGVALFAGFGKVAITRVIGSNGTLTGFAGGLAAKQWLLEHEIKCRRLD